MLNKELYQHIADYVIQNKTCHFVGIPSTSSCIEVNMYIFKMTDYHVSHVIDTSYQGKMINYILLSSIKLGSGQPKEVKLLPCLSHRDRPHLLFIYNLLHA